MQSVQYAPCESATIVEMARHIDRTAGNEAYNTEGSVCNMQNTAEHGLPRLGKRTPCSALSTQWAPR